MEPKLINQTEGMPRCDYPRPQWERAEWINLNGKWQFAFDFSRSGLERGMMEGGDYPLEILVPFCPESKLSGIGYTDFIPAVWYRRTLTLDPLPSGRALLHFGAVDYLSEVFVNGRSCGKHKGGYTSFTLDITDALKKGENTIVVYAEDDLRSGKQPFGKQSERLASYACSYTRTTGIWQTVWLEFVPEAYLVSAHIIPRAKDARAEITLTGHHTDGALISVRASFEGKCVGKAEAHFSGSYASLSLPLSEAHLWEPGKPALYDLTFTLEGGDTVRSYFGLRDLSWEGRALKINGKPVFMRTVLDQGFNPEGVYTAPDDDFLRRDIELSMALGFNGARLHQRVFEERTLYWADKLGYLVWGEFPDGCDLGSADGIEQLLPEWLESMERDFNHPALIGWCPFNETYHRMALDEETHRILYDVSKRCDPTRPVIDASGGMHYDTDMFDVHDYEQDPAVFASYFEPMKEDPAAFHCPIERYVGNSPRRPIAYKGQPYWVSEYGGTFWDPDPTAREKGWGYGDAPRTEEDFARRYEELTKVLLDHPRICGFCYTQLTDIEQEQNGLYAYDRSKKHPDWVYDRIRNANIAASAVEKEE